MKQLLKRGCLILLALCLFLQPVAAQETEWCSCKCIFDWYFFDAPTLTKAMEEERPEVLCRTQFPEVYLEMYDVIVNTFGDMVRNPEDYSQTDRYYAVWTWMHSLVERTSTVWHEDVPIFSRAFLYRYATEWGYHLAMWTVCRALGLEAPGDTGDDTFFDFIVIDGKNYRTDPSRRNAELFLLSDEDWVLYGCSVNEKIPCTAPSIPYDSYTPTTEQRGAYTFLKGTNILLDWDASSGESELVIPEGTVAIAANAFAQETSIRSVTFPEGLTDIGFNAFRGCSALESVSFPDSLICIGDAAFAHSGLREVAVPASVQYGTAAFENSALEAAVLEEGALRVYPEMFRGCSNLTRIDLPLSVDHIGAYAFADCTALSHLDLSAHSCDLGLYAFSGSGLVSVSLPEISVLQAGLFERCASLENVRLQEGLLTVENAFIGCSSLKELTIPSTVFSLDTGTFVEYVHGDGTFTYCSDDLVLRCGEESAAYYHAVTYGIPFVTDDSLTSDYRLVVQNGLLGHGTEFRLDHTAHIAYLAASHNDTLVLEEDGTMIIPDLIRYGSRYYPVTEIRKDALHGLEIEKIRLPRMLKRIDEYAFNVSRITELDLSGCPFLKEIGPHAFESCQRLTRVNLGDYVTTLEEYAFFGCSALTEFRSGGALETIGAYAFAQSGLQTAWLGESVKRVEENAFINMIGDPLNGRTAIYFEGDAPTLGGPAFDYQAMVLRRPDSEGFEQEEYDGCSTGTYVEGYPVALMDYAKIYEPDADGKRDIYLEAFRRDPTEELRAYVAFYDRDHRMRALAVSYLYDTQNSGYTYTKNSIFVHGVSIPEDCVAMTVYLVRYMDGSHTPVTCSVTYDIAEAMAR